MEFDLTKISEMNQLANLIANLQNHGVNFKVEKNANFAVVTIKA